MRGWGTRFPDSGAAGVTRSSPFLNFADAIRVFLAVWIFQTYFFPQRRKAALNPFVALCGEEHPLS